MKQNKLSFESENLQVDYLTFNIESKEPERLQKIANYFSKNFQCNSFLIDVQDSTKNRVLSQKHKKYCKAEFRTNYTKYWPGTIISFSGNHAQFFYETIKNKQLDKDIFDLDSTNIGRIDLCYDRKFKQSDCVQTLDSFLKNSCAKINFKVDNPKAEIPCRWRSFRRSFSKVAIAAKLVLINLFTAISFEYGKSKAMNVTDLLKSFLL